MRPQEREQWVKLFIIPEDVGSVVLLPKRQLASLVKTAHREARLEERAA